MTTARTMQTQSVVVMPVGLPLWLGFLLQALWLMLWLGLGWCIEAPVAYYLCVITINAATTLYFMQRRKREGKLQLSWLDQAWQLGPAGQVASRVNAVSIERSWHTQWCVCIKLKIEAAYYVPKIRYVTIWHHHGSTQVWRSLSLALQNQHLLNAKLHKKEKL